jgi:protease IV
MSGANSESGNGASGEAERPLVDALFTWMKDQEAEKLRERRRERFWRNVRFGLVAIGLMAGPLYFWMLDKQYNRHRVGENYVALVRVDGVIGADKVANAARIGDALEAAFNDQKAKGVVIDINSPGGSPVQSSIIRDRLVMLRESFPEKKVWAVGEDMLTSGAYFIAMGAPNVCVNRSTLTGSIGVIRDGWGLDKFIERFGIERRVFTAGESKSRLDTFRPLTPEDQKKASELLGAVHEHFKTVVRDGRGDRLKLSEEKLFSGDFWTGDQALQFGLVDRLCDLHTIMVEEFGATDAKDYTPPPSLVASLAGAIGAQVSERTESGAPFQLLPQ